MKRQKKSSWRFFYTAGLLVAAIFLLTQYSLRRDVPVYPPVPTSVDVIVLGSSLTGAVAVHSAAEAGVDVFYIDLGEPDAAGFPAFNPAYWAAGTPAQAEAEIEYFPEQMALEIYERGNEAGNASLILRFAEESANHLAWLEEMTNREFTVLTAPETNPGLHSPATGNLGTLVTAALIEGIDAPVTGYSRTLRPLRLLLSENRITGLAVQNENGETEEIFAQSVVLADGGFASAAELMEKFTGITATVARPEGGHRGVGLQLAMEIGADTAYLHRATLLPVFLPQGRRAPNDGFPGAVLADAWGGATDFAASLSATVQEADGRLFVIFGAENAPEDRNFTVIDTLPSLATGLGIDRAAAAELTAGLLAPYRVAVVGLMALTPGGLEIDDGFRVLQHGDPIQGLFAAGEITAGLHGEQGIADLVFAESIISARIAAREAAVWSRR